MASTDVYDLLILTDATASMGSYLQALNNSLPEIIRISALTGCFSRIGVVAYRDYCGGELTEWSGWYEIGGADSTGATTSRQQLLDFVKRLKPDYGGDWPEATKTGLACAYQHMRADAKTIMLLYTDAPPHTAATKGFNRINEEKMLKRGDEGEYGPEAPKFVDWVSATNMFAQGPKQAQIFSIVQSHLADTLAPYIFLSTRTGGACLKIEDVGTGSAVLISKITVGLLLAWMGVEKDGVKQEAALVGEVCKYHNIGTIERVTSEEDALSKIYWVMEDKEPIVKLVKDNIRKRAITIAELRQFVPTRHPAMTDFSVRYRADEGYRALVVEHLMDIIKSDVTNMTVNPIFGSLWRTVCNDRLNEARDELIQAFGSGVEAIQDGETKARMKAWLEESYDYAAEILEILVSVPPEEQYPCVFLDPTLDFKPTAAETAEDGDDEVAADPTKFTREELLEIGRSCDYRILRRLGRVLTRLTYVSAKEDLPAHIKDQPEDKVPRIPLALVQPKYKSKFWKLLLHAVLPGTMITARPAALLAALSLRMGMLPLRDAADTELIAWNQWSQWNSLDIPETWNTNCLNLILEADADFEGRVNGGVTTRPTPDAAFLKDEDRRLFKALVDYKIMEMNLQTTLNAKVGWTPSKDKAAIGPTVVCKSCHFPRSITMMANGGVCGLCDVGACNCESKETHNAMVAASVSKDDNSTTRLAWVECNRSVCRAQYVVYNVEKLNVRPKCHYCRAGGLAADSRPSKAPVMECTKCLSRIIYPTEYRPDDFDAKSFHCPACEAGSPATVVSVETSPNALVQDNGTAWLLRNDDAKIADPFAGRTLFHVISAAGTSDFADKVEILPALAAAAPPPALTIRGKLVRNTPALLAELHRWIARRRAQADSCSLCFSSFKKRALRPACGRAGCVQRVCAACHAGWYGLNARGRLLNTAALHCPFCRRRPAPGGMAAYGLSALGDLRGAVEETGEWVHGWCADCGFARRFVERVCANGPPAEVVGWICDGCRERRDAAEGVALRVKECPGCGTATEKMGGCDHIECRCGAHWCFNCGEQVGAGEIYDHMSAEHGGWYGGLEQPGDEDEESYDDEYGISD